MAQGERHCRGRRLVQKGNRLDLSKPGTHLRAIPRQPPRVRGNRDHRRVEVDAVGDDPGANVTENRRRNFLHKEVVFAYVDRLLLFEKPLHGLESPT